MEYGAGPMGQLRCLLSRTAAQRLRALLGSTPARPFRVRVPLVGSSTNSHINTMRGPAAAGCLRSTALTCVQRGGGHGELLDKTHDGPPLPLVARAQPSPH